MFTSAPKTWQVVARLNKFFITFRFNLADIGVAQKRGFNRENEAEGPAQSLYTIDFRTQRPQIDQIHVVS